MDLNIKGKCALVTGGSHGIGLAIALALADEGVNVAICSRTENRVREAERMLKKKGVKVIAMTADVFNPAEIQNVCKEILKQWGTLHILVNNVGGGGGWGSEVVEDTKENVWTEVYTKNALAAVRFTMAFIPAMKKQKWGRVITITSKFGREGGGRPWFAMSKSAEMSLLKTLALDPRLARGGITLNSVAPGNTMISETGWETMKKERPKEFAEVMESSPHGRLGTPEEVAPLVVFLASEQAAHISGASIPVDGAESRSY